MSVAEILKQLQALSPQERDELLAEIEALQAQQDVLEPEEHWGKALNRLMDEIGTIEMKYPEIEDPVEWVQHLRAEKRRQRLGNWGENREGEAE